MRILSIAVLSLFFTLVVRADSETGPLVVGTTDWNVQYDNAKKNQLYTLSHVQGENVTFMFSRWPAPGSAEEIPGFLDQMADTFLDRAKTNPKIKLESGKYTKGEFFGNPYSGNFVQFTIKGKVKLVMFMFSDGDGIWNGQYTGSADGWIEAMEVLKNIKKA